jgi:Protein of unknown function (DUF3309)
MVMVLRIAALPTWPYSTGWGYDPGGILGVILSILMVWLVLGSIWAKAACQVTPPRMTITR